MSYAKPSHQKTNLWMHQYVSYVIISIYSSVTSLASDIFKFGCKALPFFQFLAADFFLFLMWWLSALHWFLLFHLSSKLESHVEFSKHLDKWCIRPSFISSDASLPMSVSEYVTILFMNKVFTAFFKQAFTSTSANTKIQTIVLYSTPKDKKGQVPN